MGKLASLILEDFATRTAREVEVPEWGFTLHVFPLTIGQWNAIEKEDTEALRAVRTIVVRGKAADGSPLFDNDDYEKMVSHASGDKFGPAIIARVAADIMNDQPAETADEVIDNEEKN